MDIKLPSEIEIIDVTLRDGFQHEEHYIPLETVLGRQLHSFTSTCRVIPQGE